MFSGVTTHASLSGDPLGESEFSSYQENGICLTVLCQMQSLVEVGI